MECIIHNEPYRCPRCGECFPCDHKQKVTDVNWWICKDKTMVRTNSSGEIVEQIKVR